MRLAFISAEGRGETDRLLSEAAAWLAENGQNVTGVVKVLGRETPGDHHCDMDLRVLPDGPEIRITQSLGKGAQGCRLDPAGIEAAVAAVETAGTEGASIMILNKFGPQEAEGRGFCAAIGAAMADGVPVLVGVSKGTRAAFEAFAGGMAEPLPADPEAIRIWALGKTG
ncbi:MAG: 3-dehydroquinate dehydratase [Rhodobacteraceae bacterium]|nr:MAG: 3-dehydroquinate dehydratase [Paracoccaceae bacterium]